MSHRTGLLQLLGASVQSEMGNFRQKLQWVGPSCLGEISWVLAQPWLARVGIGQPADRHTQVKAVYVYRLPPCAYIYIYIYLISQPLRYLAETSQSHTTL